MTSTIHLSGVPSFWNDTNLRQTLAPFGTILSAEIVRDLFGHSLCMAVVRMHLAIPETSLLVDVESLAVKGAHVTTDDPSESDGPVQLLQGELF
jgi:hypothetical protein